MMLPPATRVYLACGFTDMRRGFDGLAAQVQTVLSLDPYGGALFVFGDAGAICSRRCTGTARAFVSMPSGSSCRGPGSSGRRRTAALSP